MVKHGYAIVGNLSSMLGWWYCGDTNSDGWKWTRDWKEATIFETKEEAEKKVSIGSEVISI